MVDSEKILSAFTQYCSGISGKGFVRIFSKELNKSIEELNKKDIPKIQEMVRKRLVNIIGSEKVAALCQDLKKI